VQDGLEGPAAVAAAAAAAAAAVAADFDSCTSRVVAERHVLALLGLNECMHVDRLAPAGDAWLGKDRVCASKSLQDVPCQTRCQSIDMNLMGHIYCICLGPPMQLVDP